MSWFDSSQRINQLIARQKYPQAIKLLEKVLKSEPDNLLFRKQIGDLLARAGRVQEAMGYMFSIVEDYLETGFVTKALATLKKMDRLEPGNEKIQLKMTELTCELSDGPGQIPVIKKEKIQYDEEIQFEEEPEEVSRETKSILASPLFKTFSPAEVESFVMGLELRTVEPGEILFTEGEPGDSLMVLASGTLRVFVKDSSGHNVQIRLLQEGDFFGEISLMSGKPRTATIVSLTDCELLEFSKKTLMAISKEHPEIPGILREFYKKRNRSEEEKAVRD